jgi:hypothetical protein
VELLEHGSVTRRQPWPGSREGRCDLFEPQTSRECWSPQCSEAEVKPLGWPWENDSRVQGSYVTENRLLIHGRSMFQSGQSIGDSKMAARGRKQKESLL